MNNKIGIIGFGNMGSAIGERIKSKYDVWVFDKDRNKTANLKGIEVAQSLCDLVSKVDTLILAVKPQDFDIVLEEIKQHTKEKLIISIAAGIPTGDIEKALGKVRVVRVMPNIGAKIGEAESVLCKGNYASQQDLLFARELFACIGKTWLINEDMVDAATAISGSGPAYIFYDMEVRKLDPKNLPELVEKYYIERLTKAAERVGFDHQTAYDLAVSTTATSLSLSVITAPAELRKQVTSPGGTTEAAIKVLADNGSWEEAALAAKKRAKELAKRS